MKAYAEKRGVAPNHFAVAWVLNNKLISGVVAGPRTEAQWDDYVKALDFKFTKEDEAFINDLVAHRPSGGAGLQRSRLSDRGRVRETRHDQRQHHRRSRSRALLGAGRRSGGTRAARWRCCTSSIRCGSPISAMRPARRFERNPKQLDCLKGLRILDIGCGGGILCEPLARLGAVVLGADPAEKNIAAAKLHAEQSGARDRLSRHDRGGIGRRGRALRHRARDGSGRACRRREAVRLALRRDGAARRADDRRHHQPHAQELRARDRRRRIRAALAAARHASAGTSSSRRTSSRSRWSAPGCAPPTSAA